MDTFSELCKVLITEKAFNLPIEEFIEKRKAGAKKIEEQTRKKGGVAKLTTVHFAAKQTPYKEALRCLKKGDIKTIEQKVGELLNVLSDWKSMTQHDFQALTGKLEAYGEVYLQEKS